MAWTVAYACDICGKQKGETNHWWMANLGESTPAGRFTLMRWARDGSQNGDMYHLCGQQCALQAMERFMTEGAIDAP